MLGASRPKRARRALRRLGWQSEDEKNEVREVYADSDSEQSAANRLMTAGIPVPRTVRLGAVGTACSICVELDNYNPA